MRMGVENTDGTQIVAESDGGGHTLARAKVGSAAISTRKRLTCSGER